MPGFSTGVGFPFDRAVANATCNAFLDHDSDSIQAPRAPFYFILRQNLVGDVPDTILTLATPLFVFWAMSLFYHCLDISGWRWLDAYRIHEPEEIKSRNLASRWQVLLTVISQHVVQTLMGLVWLDERQESLAFSCHRDMEVLHGIFVRLMRSGILPRAWMAFLELRGAETIHWLYWWGIPACQLLLSMFILDTWQYFLHRLMHSNKFLYKHFHSVHHRLYVPYAYGAMYNHPLEGFMLDTCGALLAGNVARLTVRQSLFFFTLSTAKGVHDHCGYNFPFDPFKLISDNNVEYHNIHHQAAGMKSNFSQPFFTHWDTMFGTRATTKDLENRRNKRKAKAA